MNMTTNDESLKIPKIEMQNNWNLKLFLLKIFIQWNAIYIVCTLTRVRRGELEFWNFVFLKEVKIFFDLWVGCPMMGGVGWGGGIFCRGEVSSISVNFSFRNARFQKFKKVLPVALSFSIFTFSYLRQMQGFK